MYDLTTVLTTIAACSASIVAILGGFIASKLITINAERDEVNTRIAELDEEIDFFTEERDMLQARLDEDDALDFVRGNIAAIINQRSLDDVYKEEERPQLEKEVLRPYWIRAAQVFQQLYVILQKRTDGDYAENEDGVPAEAAKTITQDFEYAVCKKICEFIEEQTSPLAVIRHSVGATVPMSTWYADTQEKVMAADNKITYLMLQRKQQATRKKALKKPKGMKLGLVLFAFFSVANIVYPLYLTPFKTENYQHYYQTKIIAIFTFAIGLALIMLYLVYLLHWNNKKK